MRPTAVQHIFTTHVPSSGIVASQRRPPSRWTLDAQSPAKGRFYRSYDMPNPWPWALLPPLQIPMNLTVDLLAPASPRIARLQDRIARWRRNTWFRNEMGDRDAHFKSAERFRR